MPSSGHSGQSQWMLTCRGNAGQQAAAVAARAPAGTKAAPSCQNQTAQGVERQSQFRPEHSDALAVKLTVSIPHSRHPQQSTDPCRLTLKYLKKAVVTRSVRMGFTIWRFMSSTAWYVRSPAGVASQLFAVLIVCKKKRHGPFQQGRGIKPAFRSPQLTAVFVNHALQRGAVVLQCILGERDW